MMDELLATLKGFIDNHITKLVAVPLAFNGTDFILEFLNAISDGVISNDELTSLVHGAGTPLSLGVLLLVYFYLKVKKK